MKLSENRYEVLKDIFLENGKERVLSKKEVLEAYKLIFGTEEKEKSMYQSILIKEEDIFEFCNAIGELLKKNKNIDFEELSIFQSKNYYFFLDKNKQIVGFYVSTNFDNSHIGYQPSNKEYLEANIEYRKAKMNELKKENEEIKELLPDFIMNNQVLFYKKVKNELIKLKTDILLRRREKNMNILEILKQKIKENKTIVTHFGDDLDNKSSIYALEKWAKENGVLNEEEKLVVKRVPAGQIEKGMLNVDTGGHTGIKLDEDGTIVIDGNPEKGVKSAAQALYNMGIYVPDQIVELADTVPNKVNVLDSRSGLALVRYLTGEQAFALAEEELLDKSLNDIRLSRFKLVEAHEKQQKIIDDAIKKVEKYKTRMGGKNVVLATEQIIGGAAIAYELGIDYYVSVSKHFDNKKRIDGTTFAITCKPGAKLSEEIIDYGKKLQEEYRIDEKTSGIFVHPNGEMIVAGGPKNPDFKVLKKPRVVLDEIKQYLVPRNKRGYDIEGYNKYGYDKEGYDRNGYDKKGFDRRGFDREGFDENGINIHGYNEYREFVSDADGYDKRGYDENGYNREGYNEEGYDERGYDENGYDKDGYDEYGYDENGLDRYGLTRSDYNTKEGKILYQVFNGVEEHQKELEYDIFNDKYNDELYNREMELIQKIKNGKIQLKDELYDISEINKINKMYRKIISNRRLETINKTINEIKQNINEKDNEKKKDE